MPKHAQARCPYTLKELDECAQVSDEHIFPAAIGGPESYCVKADRKENSTLGLTTDARFANSKLVELWRSIYGIVGRLDREPRSRLTGTVIETDHRVDVDIRQGPPIVRYRPPVTLNWETMTGTLTGQGDQVEHELKRLIKDLAAKNVKLTVTSTSSRENPTFDLQGTLSLPDMLPGALKIAYLTAFQILGDAFLDDPLNPEWQRVIRATTMPELTIAHILLGTGQSPALFPFMVFSDPWKGLLPILSTTEHRVVIQNNGESGVRATVELMGGGLRIQARISRGGDFCLPLSRARIVVCDAKESKVRCEGPDPLGMPSKG